MICLVRRGEPLALQPLRNYKAQQLDSSFIFFLLLYNKTSRPATKNSSRERTPDNVCIKFYIENDTFFILLLMARQTLPPGLESEGGSLAGNFIGHFVLNVTSFKHWTLLPHSPIAPVILVTYMLGSIYWRNSGHHLWTFCLSSDTERRVMCKLFECFWRHIGWEGWHVLSSGLLCVSIKVILILCNQLFMGTWPPLLLYDR